MATPALTLQLVDTEEVAVPATPQVSTVSPETSNPCPVATEASSCPSSTEASIPLANNPASTSLSQTSFTSLQSRMDGLPRKEQLELQVQWLREEFHRTIAEERQAPWIGGAGRIEEFHRHLDVVQSELHLLKARESLKEYETRYGLKNNQAKKFSKARWYYDEYDSPKQFAMGRNAWYGDYPQSMNYYNTGNSTTVYGSDLGVLANINAYVTFNTAMTHQFITYGGFGPPETVEERLARETREVEQATKKLAANNRAEELLFSFIGKDRAKQYQERKFFEVVVNGKTYRIYKGRSMNVQLVEGEKKLVTYCAHPNAFVPDGDTMLAQYLMLTTDEKKFLEIANKRAA